MTPAACHQYFDSCFPDGQPKVFPLRAFVNEARPAWLQRGIPAVLHLGLHSSAEAFTVFLKTQWPQEESDGDRKLSDV